MKIMKTIKTEVEEEVLDKQLCDNCNKKIEMAESCGYGAKYILSDALCNQCGGKHWDFCSLECLKDFVNNKLEKVVVAEKEGGKGK